MTEQNELLQDVAEEDELRRLLRARERVALTGFPAVRMRAERAAAAMRVRTGFAGAVLVVVALVAGLQLASRSRVLVPASGSVAPTPSASAAVATDTSGGTSQYVGCGSWSAATSPTGARFTASYGEIRNCLRVGNDWLLTTLGTTSSRGVIAVYRCGDAACLQPDADHPFDDWRITPAPGPGGVTLLGVDPDGRHVRVSNSGRQMLFDLDSLTFSG